MGHAYDRQYLSLMKQVASKHKVELQEGIYCGLGKTSNLDSLSRPSTLFVRLFPGGPCYETIAEINMLRILGGDAVGQYESSCILIAKAT